MTVQNTAEEDRYDHSEKLRARWVHQRDAESLFGRHRGDAAFVLGRPGHGQSTDPRLSQKIHDCDDDSSSEKGWRSAWHRHRDLFSQVGRQNVGPPVREGGRVRVCTISICLVNSGRHRLRGTCRQGDD